MNTIITIIFLLIGNMIIGGKDHVLHLFISFIIFFTDHMLNKQLASLMQTFCLRPLLRSKHE